MSNLRIISDNVISRAVLTATSAAPGFPVVSLQSDKKSSVWRALSTDAVPRLSAVFSANESVRAVVLPFCNLSATAQMRVRVTNEAIRTNLFRYSQQFENAVWNATTNNCTVTPDATAAPDGTTTAEKLVDNTVNGGHYCGQSIALSINDKVAVSVFVKYAGAGNTARFCMRFDSQSTATGGVISNVYVDLQNGGQSTTSSGGFTYYVTSYGNGWYRVTAVVTATASGNLVPLFMLATSANSFSFAGTGTSGMFIWGAQLEKIGSGTMSSSYYPSGSTAANRPRGYIDSWQSYGYDSGWVPCTIGSIPKLRGWTDIQAASAYANGGGALAVHWMPAVRVCAGLAVDISDPENAQGYVEAACLVAGDYWSPEKNASTAPLSMVDTTELFRTDAGDQMADAGNIFRRIGIDLSLMSPADRTAYNAITRNSRAYPLLLSVFPESSDPYLERDYTVYGRRTKDAEIATTYARAYSTTDEFEEI